MTFAVQRMSCQRFRSGSGDSWPSCCSRRGQGTRLHPCRWALRSVALLSLALPLLALPSECTLLSYWRCWSWEPTRSALTQRETHYIYVYIKVSLVFSH